MGISDGYCSDLLFLSVFSIMISAGAVTRALSETLETTSPKLRKYSETCTPSGTPNPNKQFIASEWGVVSKYSVINRRRVANASGLFASRRSSRPT